MAISKAGIYNKIYMIFIILLPLVYCDRIVDPVLIPRQLYLDIFLIITCFLILFDKHEIGENTSYLFFKSGLSVFLFTLFLCYCISAYRSHVFSESIYIITKISSLLIFYLITTFLFLQNKLDIKKITIAFVCFLSIALIIGIYQAVKYGFPGTRFFNNILNINSTFANKNLFGSILFLSLPFILNFYFFNKANKIISFFLIILILAFVFVLQVKAVIAAVIIFFIIYFIFGKKLRVLFSLSFSKRFILISTLSFSIFCLFILIYYNQDFLNMLFNSRSTANTRFILWENSVSMIKEHFIFGVGPGNWQIHFPKYGLERFSGLDQYGIITYQRPHNDFLWIFCETGILGIIAYILIFITACHYLLKLIRFSTEKTDISLYSSFLAVILGYILIAFLDFPLERIEHQVFLFLIFSFITSRYYLKFHPPKVISHSKSPSKFNWVLLLLLPLIFSVILCLYRFNGELHSRKIFNSYSKADWASIIKETDKTVNYFYKMDAMSTPIAWYKGVALFTEGKIVEAKKAFELAYEIHPFNIHVLNNLASCYEKAGDHKKAIELYKQAIRISPVFDDAILNLSAVYFNCKEYDLAFQTIYHCNFRTKNENLKIFFPVIFNKWYDKQLEYNTGIIPSENLIFLRNNRNIIYNKFWHLKLIK